jgi:hypothetical protein
MVQSGINPGKSPYLERTIMTRENYKTSVDAERITVPQHFRFILELLRRERNQVAELFAKVDARGSRWIRYAQIPDAELFARVGDHGSKFTYCHLAVVNRTNKKAVDEMRREGWRYLGTVDQAAACADEVIVSLFNGYVGQPCKWLKELTSITYEDGDERDYVASEPIELCGTVDKFRREIVRILAEDWLLLENMFDCSVDHAHVLILPYRARQAGELNAA